MDIEEQKPLIGSKEPNKESRQKHITSTRTVPVVVKSEETDEGCQLKQIKSEHNYPKDKCIREGTEGQEFAEDNTECCSTEDEEEVLTMKCEVFDEPLIPEKEHRIKKENAEDSTECCSTEDEEEVLTMKCEVFDEPLIPEKEHRIEKENAEDFSIAEDSTECYSTEDEKEVLTMKCEVFDEPLILENTEVHRMKKKETKEKEHRIEKENAGFSIAEDNNTECCSTEDDEEVLTMKCEVFDEPLILRTRLSRSRSRSRSASPTLAEGGLTDDNSRSYHQLSPSPPPHVARLRSRSQTPTREPPSSGEHRHYPSSRRGLLHELVAAAPHREPQTDVFATPRQIMALNVQRTPGGSLNVTGGVVLEQTPGGHTRRAAPVEPALEPAVVPAVVPVVEPVPLYQNILERVEALDLSDEEAGEILESHPWHVKSWVEDLRSEGQGCSSRSLLTPSASADADVVTPEVHVRPSTSDVTQSARPAPSGERGDGSDLDSEYDDEFDILAVQTNAVTENRKEIPDDEELEEPLRDIFDNIGRGMDDEVDRLPGVSDGFEWVEGFESFRGVPEAFSGPTPGPIRDYDSAYDAFVDIWDEDIISRIVLETNRYAEQTINALKSAGKFKPSSRMREWQPTNADEIMVLFGVFMFMGVDSRTSLHEYWTTGVLGMPEFRRLMSYNRYILLNKFLHFVDNSEQNLLQTGETYSASVASRKLFKLMPIIKHLEKKFDCLYNLERNISIDESLTLFKGRLSWVQTIRSKAARFGIKSYELCESHTGYMARFQIYTGKSSESLHDSSVSADLGGKSAKVVLELLQGLEQRGHCVTMDNFYNSPALARYLKRSGFDCLGTLRTNRRNVPNDIAKAPKNVPKGTIIARQCGDISIVSWKDSKLVSIISTYHNSDTFEGSKAGKVLVKPVCIRDYNSYMGGIDLKDQKLAMYLLERKRGIKWYGKMFKRLLNVSIHNAMIMLVASLKRRNMSTMTHREFRYELAKSLVDRHRPPQRLQISEPVGELMRLRRDILHVPKADVESLKDRKRCKICYAKKVDRKVRTQCKTCGVFLCFEDCWEEWHSAEQVNSQEQRGRKRTRDV